MVFILCWYKNFCLRFWKFSPFSQKHGVLLLHFVFNTSKYSSLYLHILNQWYILKRSIDVRLLSEFLNRVRICKSEPEEMKLDKNYKFTTVNYFTKFACNCQPGTIVLTAFGGITDLLADKKFWVFRYKEQIVDRLFFNEYNFR